jgi:hypothetical protein
MTIKLEIELEIDEEIAKDFATEHDHESTADAVLADVICTLETLTDCGIDNASIIDYEIKD